MMIEKNMIDATSGGALMDKTPLFGTRGGAVISRVVNEVGAFDNLRVENQLTELTLLVRQLAVGQHQQSIQRSYPNQPYDCQQFWRPPYQPNRIKGIMQPRDLDQLVLSQSNYQQPVLKYQAPSFHQQQQQQVPRDNSFTMEDWMK
ncbi:hypothetical protein CR513_11904, partial [Mucuna pruriens]